MTSRNGRPRVAVTGIGLRSPAGCDLETFWSTLLRGECVAATVDELVEAEAPVRFGCTIEDFDPTSHLAPKEARRLDRAVQLGLCAALDAIEDAGALGAESSRCAVVAATGIGSPRTLEEQFLGFHERGPRAIAPLTVPSTMPNATAALVSMHKHWTGPSSCVSTACAAGAEAIGKGAELIRSGRADVAVVGGFEAPITPWNAAAFWRVAALSTRNEDPQGSSRPFDAERDGFVMGEGAGFLLLERRDLAVARGARVYAELAGFGWNSDAFHLTAPSPDGEGAAACMRLALADAGLAPEEIGHVNAHGTSTKVNDGLEAKAISAVFGDTMPPVTAPKGVIGHLIGGGGAVEAVASIVGMDRGEVPPIANCATPDLDVDVDLVRDEPRRTARGPVISNSFAFGGHNVSLVFVPGGEG